jgi:hypothetical protein
MFIFCQIHKEIEKVRPNNFVGILYRPEISVGNFELCTAAQTRRADILGYYA